MFNFYIVLQRENISFSLGLVMLSDNLFASIVTVSFLNIYVGVICKFHYEIKRSELNSRGRTNVIDIN